MEYNKLKNFILNEMQMEDNHNYQPVMIRTLNQIRSNHNYYQ